MKKKKSKKLSWIDVKKAVNKFDYSQLVDIVKDLYQLSEENKTFLYARCLDRNESDEAINGINYNWCTCTPII